MADLRVNDEAKAFLIAAGFQGSYNDMLLAYLRSSFGVANLSLNDLLKRYIDANGYTLVSLSFSPTDIAGLVLWLDADDATTITTAVTTAVSQWDDKSTAGNNATQGTASVQPDTGLRTIGGKNALQFTAADSQFFTITNQDITNMTFFVVCGLDADAVVDGILGGTATGAPALRATASEIAEFSVHSSPAILSTSPSTIPSTGACIAVKTGTAGSEMWLDNVSQGTDGTDPAYSEPLRRIGKSGGFELGGIMGELVVYNTILTAPQITQVNAYLTSKWSL